MILDAHLVRGGLWPLSRAARAGVRWGLALVLALVPAACSTDSEGTGQDSSSGPSSSGGQSSRPAVRCAMDAPRYHAFLASGSCRDIEGKSGTWVVNALFPDAPPEIRDSACTYQWISATGETAPGGKSQPDIAALEALHPEHLTPSAERTTTCEAPTLAPSSATIIPAPDGGGASAPTGVSGCDVCAQVFARSVYVILPADKPNLRTIMVTTNRGTFVNVDLEQATGRSQVFAVELPVSEGATYVEGRVPMLVAPF